MKEEDLRNKIIEIEDMFFLASCFNQRIDLRQVSPNGHFEILQES